MKIAVIGACGRSGILVCEEALRRGHEVIGVCKNKPMASEHAYVIGDASDFDTIVSALDNVDSVISAIGHVKLGEGNTQTIAIKNIIAAMSAKNIDRIVSLTGSGVRLKDDKVSIIDKLLNVPLRIIDKSRIEDGIKHYQALKSSNLNWTILRVLKLSNSDETQSYKLTGHGPAMNLVSRKTVAKALVDIAESNTWVKQLPILSKK